MIAEQPAPDTPGTRQPYSPNSGGVNHVFHQWHEHRWAYDFETLAQRLNSAGFSTVERSAYHRSRDPVLENDRDVHARYSLYVEAVK